MLQAPEMAVRRKAGEKGQDALGRVKGSPAKGRPERRASGRAPEKRDGTHGASR